MGTCLGPGAESFNGRVGGCKDYVGGLSSLDNVAGSLVRFVDMGYNGVQFDFADVCCVS